MAETIRRIIVGIGGSWFLERDPFDFGPGGCYYQKSPVLRFGSADEALHHDADALYVDLQRVGRKVYDNA